MTTRTVAPGGVLAVALALAVLGLLAGCSDDDSDGTASTDDSTAGTGAAQTSAPTSGEVPAEAAGSLLAVVNAQGGSFEPTDGGDDTYELVLTDVDPSAVWFADRPQRGVGTFTIDELNEVFFEDQASPNAALEARPADSDRGDGDAELVVVELSEASWDAEAATLTLQARLLGADEVAETSTFFERAEQASGQVPSDLGPAALFIDDTCAAPLGEFELADDATCQVALRVVVQAGDPVRCPSTPIIAGGYSWTCSELVGGTFQFDGIDPSNGQTYGRFLFTPFPS